MRKIQITITMFLVALFVGCAGKLATGRTNVETAPPWFNDYREFKYYDEENRIYGRGVAEDEFILNTAMSNADLGAQGDIAVQIALYIESDAVRKSIAQNTRTGFNTKSSQRKKNQAGASLQKTGTESFENYIAGKVKELLKRPKREISDQWEIEKDGLTVYRAWTLWSVSKKDVEISLLERIQNDIEFNEAYQQLYLK